MIHSASFLATGSDIAAAAWVASPDLCLRISSMTFSTASASACEVDEVAATAAGTVGLRICAGVRAACRRVAGSIAGAGPEGAAGGSVFPAVSLAVSLAPGMVLGTTLRATGRGFGSGTFDLAAASAVEAHNPTASIRLAAHTVDRKAAAREDGVTTFLRGESLGGSSSRSI
jgi:hypothetical protein